MNDLESLRSLMGHLGDAGSKHDRAIVVIHEAIQLGIDTGPEIVAALHELGFNKRHIGIWLHTSTGGDPARHHWWRDDDGRYHTHDLK